MRHVSIRGKKGFKVVLETRTSQGAVMVIKPGESTSDGPENEHPKAEQWVYVVAGTGRAIVGKTRRALKEGSLLVIERGEPHQITNTGRREMVTVNVYVPPAYTKEGEVKRGAR